ncbi:MAG: hypothetical protein LBQ50_14850 [Planctomycetaceae bacterium]|jgi:hypothetical protein|nr:hypothetical protein [Planctomycetaceae bacterium]
MSTQKTEFFRPDPGTVFDDIPVDEDIIKSVETCCICNSNNSWCVPEQYHGSFVTAAAAQTISYWYS